MTMNNEILCTSTPCYHMASRDGNNFNLGCGNIICRRQATHAQAHELHFALCIVVQRQQHTTMRAISYHAQAHKLSSSHRAQPHELLITAATTTYVEDEILRASTRGIYIVSRNSDDNNTGNYDDECRRQGLGREHPAF